MADALVLANAEDGSPLYTVMQEGAEIVVILHRGGGGVIRLPLQAAEWLGADISNVVRDARAYEERSQ
jgi:hypothetical protein